MPGPDGKPTPDEEAAKLKADLEAATALGNQYASDVKKAQDELVKAQARLKELDDAAAKRAADEKAAADAAARAKKSDQERIALLETELGGVRGKLSEVEASNAELGTKYSTAQRDVERERFRGQLYPHLVEERRVDLGLMLVEKFPDQFVKDGVIQIDTLMKEYGSMLRPAGGAAIGGANPEMIPVTADLEKAIATGNRQTIVAAFNARLEQARKDAMGRPA